MFAHGSSQRPCAELPVKSLSGNQLGHFGCKRNAAHVFPDAAVQLFDLKSDQGLHDMRFDPVEDIDMIDPVHEFWRKSRQQRCLSDAMQAVLSFDRRDRKQAAQRTCSHDFLRSFPDPEWCGPLLIQHTREARR